MIQTRKGRALFSMCAVATVPLFTGCQPQTVVARVNNQTVTEPEFMARVQRVKPTNFPQDVSTDAGGITLLTIIQNSLVDQCAAEPAVNGTPSDETLKGYINQVLRMFPEVGNRLKSGDITQEELLRDIRTQLEMVAIGTEGAKADEGELNKMYDELKTKHAVDYPATYSLKFVTVPDPTLASQVLENLKNTGDFKAQAELVKQPAERLGRVTVFSEKQLPPDVVKAIADLKPNEFAATPIPLTPPAGSTQPGQVLQTQYMLAQLISKDPARTPTQQEIKAQLSQMVLQQKFKDWQPHAEQRIAEFTQKAHIEIMIDKYKPLVPNIIVANAKRRLEAASAPPVEAVPGPGAGGPAGAAPAGGDAPINVQPSAKP